MRQYYEELTLKALGTIATASQTTNHTAVDAMHYKELLVFLHVTTISGTTHTLDVHLESKGPDNFWYDLPQAGTSPEIFKFAQMSATGLKMIRLAGPIAKQLRPVSVLGAASRGRWGIRAWGVRDE